MQIDASYDKSGKVSVPVEVLDELVRVYAQNGKNEELKESAKDFVEFLHSVV